MHMCCVAVACTLPSSDYACVPVCFSKRIPPPWYAPVPSHPMLCCCHQARLRSAAPTLRRAALHHECQFCIVVAHCMRVPGSRRGRQCRLRRKSGEERRGGGTIRVQQRAARGAFGRRRLLRFLGKIECYLGRPMQTPGRARGATAHAVRCSRVRQYSLRAVATCMGEGEGSRAFAISTAQVQCEQHPLYQTVIKQHWWSWRGPNSGLCQQEPRPCCTPASQRAPPPASLTPCCRARR